MTATYGWRFWDAARIPELLTDVLLSPGSPGTWWRSTEMTARCDVNGEHEPPNPACGCGMHSLPSLEALFAFMTAPRLALSSEVPDDLASEVVPGVARLWNLPRPEEQPVVVGRVATEGRQIFSKFWTDPSDTVLAERQTIIGPLYVSPPANWPGCASLLARHYGVEAIRPDPAMGNGWRRWLGDLVVKQDRRRRGPDLGLPLSAITLGRPKRGAWQLNDVFDAMRVVGMDV